MPKRKKTRRKTKRKTTKRKKSKRKVTRKRKPAKKKARKKSKRKTRRRTKPQPVTARGVIDQIFQGNFRKARNQIQRSVEGQVKKQVQHVKVLNDKKSKEIRNQLNRARKEVGDRLVITARKDLRKIRERLQVLNTRVSQIERKLGKN